MTEETVTKRILAWLKLQKWEILAFDFPQSGTGIMLHQNGVNRTEKNKGAFIPDILAVKNGVAIILENKNRFVKADFYKINRIKINETHTDSIGRVFERHGVTSILFGIGMPYSVANLKKSSGCFDLVDFILLVTDDNSHINICFDARQIFSPCLSGNPPHFPPS